MVYWENLIGIGFWKNSLRVAKRLKIHIHICPNSFVIESLLPSLIKKFQPQCMQMLNYSTKNIILILAISIETKIQKPNESGNF
jgi:hypothetical protein